MVLRKIALIIIFSGVVKIGSSQPENPPSGDPDTVPIAGIEYLLMGGAAYGVFEVLRNRNKMKIKDGR